MSATTPSVTAGSVSLRPLAIPNEHGGWGFLFEPIVLGLLAAPSAAGALVALAAVAAFLARHPLKLAASDWLRRKRYARTVTCERLAAAYAIGGITSLAAAVAVAGPQLLLPLAIAAPLGALQFAYDARNRGRAVMPELLGAVAMGAVAASIAIAASKPIALALWMIAVSRSIPAIVYVRELLGRGRGALVAHVLAIVAAVALWRMSFAPFAAAVVFAALLVRAIVGLNRPRPAAKTIGITELIYGAVAIVTIGVAYGA